MGLELLKYVNRNIADIHRTGITVVVERISAEELDEDTINMMRKKGVKRLPAIISPDGKPHVGLENITNLLGGGVRRAQLSDKLSGSDNAEFGSNPDLAEFWSRELFNGVNRRGARIPRKDPDEDEDENDRLEKKLSKYRQNVPRHRVGGADTRRRDDSPSPERDDRRERSSRHRRRTRVDDNIGSSDEDDNDEPAPRRSSAPARHATGEDEVDARMLSAWMDNNPGGDY